MFAGWWDNSNWEAPLCSGTGVEAHWGSIWYSVSSWMLSLLYLVFVNMETCLQRMETDQNWYFLDWNILNGWTCIWSIRDLTLVAPRVRGLVWCILVFCSHNLSRRIHLVIEEKAWRKGLQTLWSTVIIRDLITIGKINRALIFSWFFTSWSAKSFGWS